MLYTVCACFPFLQAFGGGVTPAGAVVATPRVWEKYIENPFLTTTTFGERQAVVGSMLSRCATLGAEWDTCIIRSSHSVSFILPAAGGNPVSMAAAIATFSVLTKEGLPAQAAEKGAYMIDRLRQLQQK